MLGIHENSDRVPRIEAELSAENIHELAMIRQEMLDACKGGGTFSAFTFGEEN